MQGEERHDTGVAVSVLVPVLNEEAHIRDTVADLQAQRLDGELEFLFVDGRSTDGTRAVLEELAHKDARIRVFDNPARQTASGLNVGLRNARGRFVARMDAHTMYPEDYLATGVQRLERGDFEWVSGPQIAYGTDKWSRRVALALNTRLGTGGAAFRREGQEEIEVDTGFTGIWRRSTLEAFGGWDEGWPINQDSELAARIRQNGGRIVCLPQLAARYIPRNSLRKLARQYFRYGYYRLKTSRRHPSSMRRSQILPPALALAAVAAVIAPGRLAFGARAIVATYALSVIATSASTARTAGWEDAASLPAVFATMHLAWGFGFIAGSLRFGPPLAALASAASPGGRRAGVGPAAGP